MKTTTNPTLTALETHIARLIEWARSCTSVEGVERYEMQAFGAVQFVVYSGIPGEDDLYDILSKKWSEEWQPVFWEIATSLPEPEPKRWRLG